MRRHGIPESYNFHSREVAGDVNILSSLKAPRLMEYSGGGEENGLPVLALREFLSK